MGLNVPEEHAAAIFRVKEHWEAGSIPLIHFPYPPSHMASTFNEKSNLHLHQITCFHKSSSFRITKLQ
jgi:hypothetical protein